jgi:hypothetical protein
MRGTAEHDMLSQNRRHAARTDAAVPEKIP